MQYRYHNYYINVVLSAVDVTVMVLLTVLGIVGLLICFAGHNFFKIGKSCDSDVILLLKGVIPKNVCNCNDVEQKCSNKHVV